MKKSLLCFVVVALSVMLFGCKTTMTKGSGIKGNKIKVDTGKRVLVDYQGATFGSEIPEWVKMIGEGQYSTEALNPVMPGVGGKKVFVVTKRGNNLSYVEQWADLVSIETEVAGIMERVAGKCVEAEMKGSDNDELQETLNMYRISMTDVRLSGLEKVASFWIKVNVLNSKKEVEESYYEYYAVWGMDKKLFDQQLKQAMKAIDETTTESQYLKAKVTAEILDKVADGEVAYVEE